MISRQLLLAFARNRLKKKRITPQQTLKWLLKEANDTDFGLRFDFSTILKSKDPYHHFAQTVPISDYTLWLDFLGQDYAFDQDEPVPLDKKAWPGTIRNFCLSSGTTTGKTKYIPYSDLMAKRNRQAAVDLLCRLILNAPSYHPLWQKTLYMSGSTKLKPNAKGALAGDMSGLTKYLAPKFLSWLTYPPEHISSTEPWAERLPLLAEFAIKYRKQIGVLSGIPVWQLSFLQEVQSQSGDLPGNLFPNMAYLIHGGMPLGPYREPLRELLGDQVQFVDVYAASETGISAVGFEHEPGLELWPQFGVFYEFEDKDANVHPIWDVEPQAEYTLLVSSCSGLWRYRIGDRVRVLSTDPIRIDTVFRAQTTTAFDEKVTEEQVLLAVQKTCSDIADFSLGPDLKANAHAWFLLTEQDLPANLAGELDKALRSLNQDYDDYREDGRIREPSVTICRDRTAFLKQLGREEGGQRKFPRLLSPEEVQRLIEPS